jgi:hypothetical protein
MTRRRCDKGISAFLSNEAGIPGAGRLVTLTVGVSSTWRKVIGIGGTRRASRIVKGKLRRGKLRGKVLRRGIFWVLESLISVSLEGIQGRSCLLRRGTLSRPFTGLLRQALFFQGGRSPERPPSPPPSASLVQSAVTASRLRRLEQLVFSSADPSKLSGLWTFVTEPEYRGQIDGHRDATPENLELV